ncbi:integrase/recombinase, partial [mine drainage metagenome]
RSHLSADTYLRQLGFLLERIGISPDEAVRLAQQDPDKLRDLLIKDAAKLKSEGKLDSYISKFFEGLRSYLKFNRVAFDGFPALSPIRGESLVNERVPTPEELGRVLDRLSLRGRVAALFMAHAGVRPGVLAAYQAAGGLTLKDIPDLTLGKSPSFTNIPFAVRVPASLSKTRVAYTTFGPHSWRPLSSPTLTSAAKGEEA